MFVLGALCVGRAARQEEPSPTPTHRLKSAQQLSLFSSAQCFRFLVPSVLISVFTHQVRVKEMAEAAVTNLGWCAERWTGVFLRSFPNMLLILFPTFNKQNCVEP